MLLIRFANLQRLIAEWKELVDQWVNTTKELTDGAEGTPESANPSVVDEEEAFPSLPYDVDIFTPQPDVFEMGNFFDSMDFDANPRNTSQEHERRPQNIAKRRPEGSQSRIQDAPLRSFKPSSAPDFDETRRPLKQNTEQRMVPQEAVMDQRRSAFSWIATTPEKKSLKAEYAQLIQQMLSISNPWVPMLARSGLRYQR